MQDYIIALQKSEHFCPGLLPRSEKQEALYNNPDNDPRGPWTSGDLLRNEYRERDQYEIIGPTGKSHRPPMGTSWRHPQEQIERMISENRVWFGSDGNGVPRVKRFLSETKQGVVISGWWPHTEAGHNDEAKKEVKRLLKSDVFQTPKPIRLLKRIFQTAGVKGDDIIIDFFAGSGTTAHALMDFNRETGNSARSIIVQLPEILDPENKSQKLAADFADAIGRPRNIAELTKERLRRAGQKVRAEHPAAKVDTGFRVYKLATSNLKPWQPDPDNLEASILDAVDNVLPDRSEHDLLVELLLKTGIDLTMPEERRTIAGQTVHALGGGALMVCLGKVGPDDAETLGQGMADWLDELDPTQTTIYFKDTGLGTENNRSATKANLAAILRQRHGDRIAKIASI
jgi:adenine-specific DNA-methyltransferase